MLAVNPRVAISPPGPFESRPAYRFTIMIDGTETHLQVLFYYADTKSENKLFVFAFSEAPDDP